MIPSGGEAVGPPGGPEARREMPKTKSARNPGCPVAAFQKMISGKYKLRIVWDLRDGPRRYGQIRRGLLRGMAGSSEIAPRTLSRELKALVAFGLLDRKDYGAAAPKVEYFLTAKGRSFIPIVSAIRDWGHRNLEAPAAAEIVSAAA